MGLAFSPDGKRLVRATIDPSNVVDGRVRIDSEIAIFRVADASLEQQFPSEHEETRAPTFSPDGSLLAYDVGYRNTVKLWDLDARRVMRVLYGHHSIVNSIAFTPEGKSLATASPDRTIRIWDVATGRE